MSAKNDHTGDSLISRPNSKAFDENFDRIFRKKEPIQITRDDLIADGMFNLKSRNEIKDDILSFRCYVGGESQESKILSAKQLLESNGYHVEKVVIYQD